ncbi:acyl-CoA thioesterase [Marinomonas transparens]|uniref:Acyl-CoA thioesterase n=1 Tax=Marinomonas transparens TaxID=2795388 RepID=A0A934JPE0_9GAMM|nr:acyl-CoA thioesterase [Marinomonas transparens]MBJ7538198.1 acyl-CoA thioesterase [Marinomonas transparens]
MEDKGKQDKRMTLEVRDYECDMQGIVNNSVYQNYLEHARHSFIKTKGLDFAKITAQGVHLVLIKAELEYKKSLISGDSFYIETNVESVSKLKTAFYQDLYRSDGQLILKAKMIVASITKEGRPIVYEELNALFEE